MSYLRRYTFLVGAFEPRRSFTAETRKGLNEAFLLAREGLDLQAEEEDREPPVAWDLELDTVERIEK